MAAFYNDLAADGRANDVALVVQTEFGRQVKENANNGTDHGLGCPMMVLGGGVQGGGPNGSLFGNFPGLAPAQRIGDSLEPTTDFRQVLATVAAELMDHPNVNAIFDDPNFNYQNVGFA